MGENDAEETLSPMLLEDSPPPDDTKKRAWPCWLQIPLGILIVGLVGGGVFCFLSFADSKDVERVKAGNISLGDFQERNRRHVGCLIENNIVYWGNDIANKIVETSQACADFCASTPGGLFWTFDTKTKRCYVKSSDSGRKTRQDRISGNRKCGGGGDGGGGRQNYTF